MIPSSGAAIGFSITYVLPRSYSDLILIRRLMIPSRVRLKVWNRDQDQSLDAFLKLDSCVCELSCLIQTVVA